MRGGDAAGGMRSASETERRRDGETQCARDRAAGLLHAAGGNEGEPRKREGGGACQAFQGRGSGPTYSASGRMMRLLACCSMMCAHQPVTREATKIGVYWGTGIPIA